MINSINEIGTGQALRLKRGRMTWIVIAKREVQTASGGHLRYIVIERHDNLGRHHLKTITARDIERGAVREN